MPCRRRPCARGGARRTARQESATIATACAQVISVTALPTYNAEVTANEEADGAKKAKRKAKKEAGEAEIIAWCKERLAAYKYPRIIEVRESLPKGPTGKLLKRELR